MTSNDFGFISRLGSGKFRAQVTFKGQKRYRLNEDTETPHFDTEQDAAFYADKLYIKLRGVLYDCMRYIDVPCAEIRHKPR